MEPWRTILLLGTLAGFALTVFGLLAAYRAAVREFQRTKRQVTELTRLQAERDELDRDMEDRDASQDERDAMRAGYRQQIEALDVIVATYDNIDHLPLLQTAKLLESVVAETRRDFIIAGSGLVVSTAASVGSLYI